MFADSKVIFSVYDDDFSDELNTDFTKKIKTEGISDEDLSILKTPNYTNLNKLAINYTDAVIEGCSQINPQLKKYISENNVPFLPYQSDEDYIDTYSDFYDKVLEEKLIKTNS